MRHQRHTDQRADRSLLEMLRRVARRPAAGALTADQALLYIRQVIEDAQPEEFHAASEAECKAWTAGIRAYHANLLRAFQLEDEFEVSPVVWEIAEE